MSELRHRTTGVSLRAVLIGAVLTAAISVISPWGALLVKGSELTSNAIPIIAVLFLFALVAVVMPVLKALTPRLGLSRAELIVVFIMMLAGSVVPTKGLAGSFLSVVTGPIYYATPENNWDSLFLPYIHEWLAPTDRQAVRFLYEGLPQGMDIPWSAWLIPFAAWAVFLLAFYWTLFCTGVLLRGQWLDNEQTVYSRFQRRDRYIDAIEASFAILRKHRLDGVLKIRRNAKTRGIGKDLGQDGAIHMGFIEVDFNIVQSHAGVLIILKIEAKLDIAAQYRNGYVDSPFSILIDQTRAKIERCRPRRPTHQPPVIVILQSVIG